MARWLAIYSDDLGDSRAAVITATDPTLFPYGVDDRRLGLDSYNEDGGLILVSVPDDFRPDVVDARADREVEMQFIDI